MPVDEISGPFCEELSSAVEGAYGAECAEEASTCCREGSLFYFNDVEVTEIGYGPLLTSRHGISPQVRVFYWTGEEDFLIGGTVFTRISVIGSPPEKIIVNHGGRASGIIKII